MAITYTTIVQRGGKNATGLQVPDEVVTALGTSKNPKVKATLNGYTYRGTVQVMGGVFMLSLSAAHREAAGVHADEQVEVSIELDEQPRTVEVPEDLRAALAGKVGASEAFDNLAYSRRKEFVRQVNEAKAQETRTRRIAAIVAQLGDGGLILQPQQASQLFDKTDDTDMRCSRGAWHTPACNAPMPIACDNNGVGAHGIRPLALLQCSSEALCGEGG